MTFFFAELIYITLGKYYTILIYNWESISYGICGNFL